MSGEQLLKWAGWKRSGQYWLHPVNSGKFSFETALVEQCLRFAKRIAELEEEITCGPEEE